MEVADRWRYRQNQQKPADTGRCTATKQLRRKGEVLCRDQEPGWRDQSQTQNHILAFGQVPTLARK